MSLQQMFVIMYVIIIAVPRSSIILNCSFCLFALPAISSPNPWLWKLFCFLSLCFCIFYSVQFNRSVMFDSLRPHGLQHTSPPCPSPTPGAYSTHVHRVMMPSNHLILCCPLLPPSLFPNIRVFSNESVLRIR